MRMLFGVCLGMFVTSVTVFLVQEYDRRHAAMPGVENPAPDLIRNLDTLDTLPLRPLDARPTERWVTTGPGTRLVDTGRGVRCEADPRPRGMTTHEADTRPR